MKVNYIDEFFVLRNLSTVLFFFLNRHIASLHISILNLCGRPFSKCTPSSSCVKPVVASHGRLCPLAVLFVRRTTESQALPLLLSFHQHHVVLGSQFFPGCPVLVWSHLDQVPQGLLGRMSCMSTSRFVRHYKLGKMKQAVKKRNVSDKTPLALDNFICHLAFQWKWGSSSLMLQVWSWISFVK